MNQKFERIARHLYQRSTAPPREIGPRSTARFVFRLKGESRVIPLDSDESLAKDKLKKIEAQDVDLRDFDLDRQRLQEPEKECNGKSAPFNFAEWSEKYPTFDDVKRKRSLPTDLLLIKHHLKPVFGAMLLTEIIREALTRYIDKRLSQPLIRGENGQSKKMVARGTSIKRAHRGRGEEAFGSLSALDTAPGGIC